MTQVDVQRKDIRFIPDSSRVVARFFNNGEERTRALVQRIIALDDENVARELDNILLEFVGRHRNISKIFLDHFENHLGLVERMELNGSDVSQERKLLIGAYSTMEYSIESAAIFNPSIIEDFNQSFLAKGAKGNNFVQGNGRRASVFHSFSKGNTRCEQRLENDESGQPYRFTENRTQEIV